MPRFGRSLSAVALVLLSGAFPAGRASAPSSPPLVDTGERFTTPIDGRVFRVLLNTIAGDEAAGTKVLEDAGGRRWTSVEAAVRDEEQALPPLRRTVHPDLWPLLDDPARAAEPVRVVLVLRDQPLRDASLAVRERSEPAIRERVERIRDVLAGVAPLRAEDPARALQLGHRMEEEALLLGAERREELRHLRAQAQALVREMRRAILDLAKPACALAQAPVVARLGQVPGARVLSTAFVLNCVSAEVPAGVLKDLVADLPGVARVLPHRVRTTGLNTSTATFGAATWTGAGYDGSSTTKVSIMDTGIDANHPAFFRSGNSILTDQAVYLSVGSQDPFFQDNASSTDDIFGHGSHVGGIVMSQDTTYMGVAPGGALMNAKCGYNSSQGGNLQDGDIMSAGDWSADNGADAVNASFGGDDTTNGNSALSLFFDALVDGLGVAAAVAAGNSGPGGGTVGVPGDAFNVMTVGSINDAGTTTQTDNSLSSFSSRGPLDDGRRKPDLCAPGSSITSVNYVWEGGNADFVAYDGTSMATPHVAGACALLLDYAASWRPEGLKALLMTTTRNLPSSPALPNNNAGWGAGDLAAAYASRGTLYEGTLSSSGASYVLLQSPSLTSGQRVTLCWNRDVAWNNASAPVTYRALVDLDLTVYDESTGASLGSSLSALNSAEQVALSSGTSFPVIKVRRAGAFPSGQSSVAWAVASESTGSMPPVPTPPTLSAALETDLDLVKPGDTVTVTATVTNTGDLLAFAPQVTLTLPVGYSIASGTNPRTLSTVAAGGGTRTATWTVTAGGLTGAKTLSVAGTSSSYGESFAIPEATAGQTLDATGPSGVVVVEDGAAAVSGPAVTVALFATDDSTGVDGMRVRNSGAAWGEWQDFADSFPWNLAPGEGTRTVEVQLRDGAGNESGTLSDSTVVDATAPTGAFVLSGDVPYLLPWEDLTADTAADDGEEGSGVAAIRVRWKKGALTSSWTAWADIGEVPVVPLARPASDGDVEAEAEFRDAAGNVSSSAFDAIYLVEPGPPSLTAARSFAGSLAAGGDVDAFDLGAVAGDFLTVKVRAKPPVKGSDFSVELDLIDPAGGRVVLGRYPSGAAKPGIVGFPVSLTGDHWILARPSGAAAAAGGTYTLSIKRTVAKSNRRLSTGGDPEGGFVEIPFAGVQGTIATGVLRGLFTGDPEVLRPDDTTGVVVTLAGAAGSRKIPGLVLTGGSGIYVLRIPATGPVAVDLKLRPPPRLRLVEAGE